MSTPSRPKTMPKHLKATYLGDQEVLLEETRGTRWHYFPGPFLFVVVFGILSYLSWGGRMGWTFTHTYAHAFATFAKVIHLAGNTLLLYFGVVFAFLLVVGLFWFFVRYLRWVSTVYAVTTHRVIVQKGILGKDFDEIPVNQVRGVDVHQSAGQRFLRYGTLTVSSEGGSKLGNEDWEGIPRPFQFQKRIENATEAIDSTGRSGH